MPEAISDTGPVLHLSEIGCLPALATVARLLLPELVVSELASRDLSPSRLKAEGIRVEIVTIETGEWQRILRETETFEIQPADAQVFTLARSTGFRTLVLTDDLALRRLLEQNGATVAGSVGVLVRTFRSYIRRLLTEIP